MTFTKCSRGYAKEDVREGKERKEMVLACNVDEFVEKDLKNLGELMVKFGQKILDRPSNDVVASSNHENCYELLYGKRKGAKVVSVSKKIMEKKTREQAKLK